VDLSITWLECRTGRDLDLVSNKLLFAQGASRRIPLGPRSATNVTVELVSQRLMDEEPILCCQINWVQRDVRLRSWLRKVDTPMYWASAVLRFNWNPPWQNGARIWGQTFVSNFEVEDYFNRVYGFTRKQWLEERRAEQKRQGELTQLQAKLGTGYAIGQFYRRTEPMTDREQAKLEAKAAFDTFCATSTNGVARGKRIAQ